MNNMVAILFLLFFTDGIAGFIENSKQNQKVQVTTVTDYLEPAISTVVTGHVGDVLALSYKNRILVQDYERLVATFTKRTETSCWQTEFWGKWFTSAVLAYRYHPTPELKDILDKAVSGLIATQTPDGYIGNYTEERRLEGWDIWGRKYCMLGLVAYYDLTKDKKALQAAEKEADCLIKELSDKNALIVKKGSHRGMAASSVLEPICLLYGRTGEKRYLDFAEEIVRQWETPDGPRLISKASVDVSKRFPIPDKWYGPEQGQKAYEMMSCYEGLLELYRLTGNKEYLTSVEKTWQNIRDTEINIVGSGSAMECWFGGKKLQTVPIHHYQETCVTVTWIKLTQQLLRLTGEAKYADAFEQSYYNALLGAMTRNGSSWGYYSPLSGYKIERKEQCGMGIHCCKANGPRALFLFPFAAVTSSSDGVQVNLFAGGNYILQTPKKQKIQITQITDYPVDSKIAIKLGLPKQEEMAIRIRIPAWSKQNTLNVNGNQISGLVSGEYATIQRTWKDGDEISLELDMRGRVKKLGEQPENLAIMRGPIVLAQDSRLPGPPLDTWVTPIRGEDGYLDLKIKGTGLDGVWMQFTADCTLEPYGIEGNLEKTVTFCDYSSAGNTYDEYSRFRVWFTKQVDPRKL